MKIEELTNKQQVKIKNNKQLKRFCRAIKFDLVSIKAPCYYTQNEHGRGFSTESRSSLETIPASKFLKPSLKKDFKHKAKAVEAVMNRLLEVMENHNERIKALNHQPSSDIEVHFDEVEKLPEKWCVYGNEQELVDYANLHGVYRGDYNTERKHYYHFPAADNNTITTSREVEDGYTEISFETFKRLVLKEDERIPNIIPGTYYEYIGNETGLLVLTDIKEHDNKLLVYGTCVNNPTSYDIAVVGQHRVWAKSSLKKWSGTHTRKQI